MAEEKRDRGGMPERGRRDEGRRPNQGQPAGQQPMNQGSAPRREAEGSRRFGRRRFGRPFAREDRARAEQGQNGSRERIEPVECPLCGKPVYDLSTAIAADKEGGAPAHFDCVLERVAQAENLAPGERVVYLGSGAFGVVEFKDRSESAFVVKRRIQWEKEGEKKDWRRALSARIQKI